jgi:predicted ArsR family transcriptional regulator
MEFSKSQVSILQQLKMHGPQSVKILANRLGITTMGVRQHLDELYSKDLVGQTAQEKQTRGRPVRLWKLSALGHGQFPNTNEEVTVDLITMVRDEMGDSVLEQLVEIRTESILHHYKDQISKAENTLESQLQTLARLRTEEGYMAQLRLLPDRNWLLVENHCPIYAAATACQQFCSCELSMFQQLLEGKAIVERVDHLLHGARRCAFRITSVNNS